MAMHSAHAVARTAADSDQREKGEGVGGRIVGWLRQACCSLRGHDSLMRFEKERVYLQCSSCGHESPGWMLKEARPNIARGDARQTLARPQFLGARRIA